MYRGMRDRKRIIIISSLRVPHASLQAYYYCKNTHTHTHTHTQASLLIGSAWHNGNGGVGSVVYVCVYLEKSPFCLHIRMYVCMYASGLDYLLISFKN